MPDENLLRTLQKPLLSKSWQTNKASFITFPIPSVFCACNLRAGCAEQLLTVNCHTDTRISLPGRDMRLQESAFGLFTTGTSTILALGK